MKEAVQLLAQLRLDGFTVEREHGNLRLTGPRTAVSADLQATIAAHKAGLLVVLEREEVPCQACGAIAWRWVNDWPVAGEARWLCEECLRYSSPDLAVLAAGLPGDDRARLDLEAMDGDALANLVLEQLSDGCITSPDAEALTSAKDRAIDPTVRPASHHGCPPLQKRLYG